ncbi:MAG: isoprenylcysteine carboxylmethyltransferase family protein [Caulobacteraceae bacterium]
MVRRPGGGAARRRQRLDLGQGWTYIGEVTVLSTATTVWLYFNDPELLKARMTSPFKRNQRPADRAIIIAFGVLYGAWFVLIALDARRFLWTSVPLVGQVGGAVLIGAGLVLVWETFRANTFATTQVRVQAEREQTVVDSGPLPVHRHPMYAGMALTLLGEPLMLGSLWGLAAAPVLLAFSPCAPRRREGAEGRSPRLCGLHDHDALADRAGDLVIINPLPQGERVG